MNDMACKGDGWHKVGTGCKVRVENRVIVEVLRTDLDGNWIPSYITRWNFERHTYERCGFVTLAAFRAGINRSTMSIH